MEEFSFMAKNLEVASLTFRMQSQLLRLTNRNPDMGSYAPHMDPPLNCLFTSVPMQTLFYFDRKHII